MLSLQSTINGCCQVWYTKPWWEVIALALLNYIFVWKNIATPRVKFFGWLLTKDRIVFKSNLLSKRVLQEDICAIRGQASETADHLISGCPFAQAFWRQIDWLSENTAGVRCLWESIAPVDILKVARNYGTTDMMLCSRACPLCA